jgi:16S rRNA (cytidine1402-2'-O)-methyltransferase
MRRLGVTLGTLYLCATPIGNLEDMTFRAVRILKSVTLIAAEDTRHTRKLLSHFDIHVPLTSYHEHNKMAKGPELVEKLLAGDDVALVSDAGMPGISDPGEELVALAVGAGIPVVPLPGANAALSALVASALPTSRFMFAGFLPKTGARRKEILRALAIVPETLVFYESPHHLEKTLKDFLGAFGDRQTVVGRELTKIHEEFVRGSLSELQEHFRMRPPRGECTLVVSGCPESETKEAEPPDGASIRSEVENLVRAGANKKDAIKQIASQRGLSRNKVYGLMLESVE